MVISTWRVITSIASLKAVEGKRVEPKNAAARKSSEREATKGACRRIRRDRRDLPEQRTTDAVGEAQVTFEESLSEEHPILPRDGGSFACLECLFTPKSLVLIALLH